MTWVVILVAWIGGIVLALTGSPWWVWGWVTFIAAVGVWLAVTTIGERRR